MNVCRVTLGLSIVGHLLVRILASGEYHKSPVYVLINHVRSVMMSWPSCGYVDADCVGTCRKRRRATSAARWVITIPPIKRCRTDVGCLLTMCASLLFSCVTQDAACRLTAARESCKSDAGITFYKSVSIPHTYLCYSLTRCECKKSILRGQFPRKAAARVGSQSV